MGIRLPVVVHLQKKGNHMLYRTVLNSPIGPLTLVSNDNALVAVNFDCDPAPSHAAPAPDHPILADAVAQLEEYFAGKRASFSVPLELPGTGFHAQAQAALADIPCGSTWSYGQLAAQAGNPAAIRAAGTACARNPLPLFLPCHRIVRSDGRIGNYRGGTAAKVWLLDFEQTTHP